MCFYLCPLYTLAMYQQHLAIGLLERLIQKIPVIQTNTNIPRIELGSPVNLSLCKFAII